MNPVMHLLFEAVRQTSRKGKKLKAFAVEVASRIVYVVVTTGGGLSFTYETIAVMGLPSWDNLVHGAHHPVGNCHDYLSHTAESCDVHLGLFTQNGHSKMTCRSACLNLESQGPVGSEIRPSWYVYSFRLRYFL